MSTQAEASGARFRRAPGARPLVFGHRGARREAPENTLKAFELALAAGAEGVELDVRFDGSGEVVVFHDLTLERMTGGLSRQHVEELSTWALQSFDLGGGERVPPLAEVLAWAEERGALVNVEVKADGSRRRALAAAVVERIRDRPRVRELVLCSSFHPGIVRELSRRLPGVAVAWLVHEKQRVFRGAPGYRWLGASGVHPQHTLLDAARVARWKRHGSLVNTWTVNDPALARRYAAEGVDGIISDVPAVILAALSEPP